MIFMNVCSRCKGEGRRRFPQYNPMHPDIPYTWEEKIPCSTCKGLGYTKPTKKEIHLFLIKKEPKLFNPPKEELALL